MSLLTCVNNLKGNDYAVDFLQTTITVSLLFGNYNFINLLTIKQFKQEIKDLTKAQKVAKRINHQSEVYRNRGSLHAMYVAYYILKHKLVGDAQEA